MASVVGLNMTGMEIGEMLAWCRPIFLQFQLCSCQTDDRTLNWMDARLPAGLTGLGELLAKKHCFNLCAAGDSDQVETLFFPMEP
jgi:hypothetical protein